MASPRLSFGVIADLHYMDAEDGSNYDRSRIRRYRRSLSMLHQACDDFRSLPTRFNVLLGDVADGGSHKIGVHHHALDAVLALTLESTQKGGAVTPSNTDAIDSSISVSESPVTAQQRDQGRWYAVVGNHEHYNFSREVIYQRLIPAQSDSSSPTPSPSSSPSSSPRCLYYSFIPQHGFRCIVLDSFEVSTMGGSTPEHVRVAEELIRTKNHNCASGNHLWFQNLAEEFHRYIPCNGGLGDEQVEWLRKELDAAIARDESCIVFSHIPIFGDATTPANIVWNSEEVLALLHSTPRGTVLACIAGHDHDGGYAVDAHGIHHLVPHAPIECAENEVTYGAIHIHDSYIDVQWFGCMPANKWPDRLPLYTK